MRPSNRAISTSIDVIIALLVLSGAITMLFIYGESSSQPPQDEEEADQLADLISTATVEVNYTVVIGVDGNTNTYHFSETGTILHHLKRATLLNATFRTAGGPAQSFNIPCEVLATRYQGAVKEQYRDQKKPTGEWYSNNKRYPPRFYDSDGKIKPGYRVYQFRAFKPQYINDTGESWTFADSITNASGNISEAHLNDEGLPKMSLSIDVLRSEVEDIPCNPTGALHTSVRQNYNATTQSTLTDGNSKFRPFVKTNYMEKIDQKIDQNLRTDIKNYRIETSWQPYDRPDGTRPYISSRTVLGETPVRDEETHTARLVVPSGMPTAEEVRSRQYTGGIEESIAAAIAEGYFPRAEERFALERGESSQAYAQDRYIRFAAIASYSGNPELARDIQAEANKQYSADTRGLRDTIAGLLGRKFKEEDFSESNRETLRSTISTGRVDVVVMTWEEE